MKYLFGAYTIIWIVLFIYLFSLSRRMKSVEKEIESLAQKKE